ncbi:MAG: flagellar hook-associated protein FlgK, partial [Synergistaceae bacterium]|nr:flagellar hook-associated protein FlgK [Synergistaceae bacterium]
MLNTFAGLEMGQRALNAFRLGIQTAGHNISNVNTEGYSRQRVNLATTFPYDYPTAGQVGTGVKATDIIRIRDEFLDYQYRLESQTAGYWEKINEFYNTLQVYFAEPGGEGVSSALNSFWSSLNDLQVNPESIAIRETVVQNAKTLGNMLDNLINNMDNYASSVNKEIRSAVDEANTILYEIASLNKQIAFVQASEQNPNDLLDKRDLLLDKLSKMIDIDIQEPFQNGDLTGEFFVTLNGRTLVQGDKVRELVAHAFEWGGKVYYDVQVLNNEFDIVEDPRVALALATGPEGVHQLVVDRISNGGTWSVGGSDARCLNPNGSLKNILTSQTFANGIVAPSGDTGTYNFDITSGDYTASFTVTGSGTDWTVTATITGPGGTVVGTYTGSPIDNNGSGELVL